MKRLKDATRLKKVTSDINNLKEVRKSNVHNTNFGLNAKLFKGAESLENLPAAEEDFRLPIDDHIAIYDVGRLVKEWNRNEVPHRMLAKLYNAFMYGLPRRIGPVLIYFLIIFYSFQYLRLSYGCVPSGYKSEEKDASDDFGNRNPGIPGTIHGIHGIPSIVEKDDDEIEKKCNGPDPFKFFEKADYWFSKICVWLLGIYVSIVARRYWRQINSLPRMDRIIMVLNATVWCDPKKKEDEIEITENISVKQLKMTIARWHLLSWTMALSRISPKLKRTYNNPKAFNDSRLITKQEYFHLNGKYSEDDTWLVKWSIPLIWAHKLILQTVRQPIDEKVSCIKEHKDLTNHITKFQRDLEVILNHHGVFKPSPMAYQALTLALHVFIIFSAVGGPYDVYGTYDEEPMIIKLAAIFPLYHMMKILLVIGWALTAKDLENPFGDDEYVENINLQAKLIRIITQSTDAEFLVLY